MKHHVRSLVSILLLGILVISAGCSKDSDDPTNPSTQEYTITVAGNAAWTDTTIAVSVNETVTITAHGSVIYDNGGNSCGPAGAGWTDSIDKEDPMWDQPHVGLIAKIGAGGSPFFIGASTTFTIATGGKLYLGINDSWFEGNTGEFTVIVKVTTE